MNKGVEKAAQYIKLCEKPGIVLVDSKPTYQAKQRLDKGLFLSSRKMQDLLANLSAKRMGVQQISTRLLSPLLKIIDFKSQNSVECTLMTCTLCKEMKEANITFSKVYNKPNLQLISKKLWREIQYGCTDLARVASLITTRKAIKKKEKG